MDRCGTNQGHLVVFDRRGNVSWEEKIFQRQEKVDNTVIKVWGM